MRIRLTIISVISILLVSCGGKPLEPDPAPLYRIKSSVKLESIWRSEFSSGRSQSESAFLNLLPILDEDQIVGASANGIVAAIDKHTGSVQWSIDVASNIIAGVGKADGVAAVVTEERKVIAIDSESGEVLWDRQIEQTVFAPPLVYSGLIILQTIDGDLLALDVSDGEIVWDALYDQPEFVVFGSPRPIGIGSIVLVGNATGRLFATDIATGLEAWQIYLAAEQSESALGSADTIPVIFGDKLFVADYTKAVVAYDLRVGDLFWEHRRSANRRLVVDSENIYGTDLDDTVFALSRDDGTLRWEQKELRYRSLNNIALVGEYLILGEDDGIVHILNTQTGEFAGRARLKGDVLFGGFLTDGNKLYITYRSGRVQGYELGQPK